VCIQVDSGTPAAASAEVKTEPVDETGDTSAASWSILRDDFMIGARMRDWDKQTCSDDDDDDDDTVPVHTDSSDDNSNDEYS